MANNVKPLKRQEVTIGGITYTLQLPGRRWVAALEDRCRNRYGVINTEPYLDSIFEHVITNPKVSFEYFDDISKADYEELIAKIGEFL